MQEKELLNFYNKYVKNKSLYRVVSEEYAPSIKKHGFVHDNDPFKKNKKDIFKFFDILLKLKKKGFIMMRWWGKPVDQEIVVKASKKDININYIDFTQMADNIKYYLDLPGGALVQTILIYSSEILMKTPELSNSDFEHVKKMYSWAKKKSSVKNMVVSIKASSRYFENAEFQIVDRSSEYSPSPFGSFENFKKAILKKGFPFYKPFLTGKKLFYLRTVDKIPASEIIKIK